MSENLVETRKLTKHYPGGVIAVRDLELTISRGDVYGFLGPNGAGKTTTLKMLVGLIRPTSGSAVVAGAAPGSPASLRAVGAMVESPAFWPYLSGRDNLRVVARYAGLPDARIGPVLEEVELTQAAQRAFSTYSTGMKQRLGVAAALLKNPELLILDEPTSGLDPQGMAEFRALIKGLGAGERTVLVSSHLLAEAEQICNRVGVIRKGQLVAEGTLEEIRGGAQLLVHAEPAESARRLLTELIGADHVRPGRNGEFVLQIDGSRAADINRRLVAQGIDVSELHATERSLEDVFMELTGTESGL